MLFFALIAGAVEPPDDDGFSYTITVHGAPAIRQARWDAIIALKRLGWKPRDRNGGRTVFKPPRPWLGRAELDADGNLYFRYPLVRFRSANLAETEPYDPTESNPNMMRAPGGHVFPGGVTLPAGQAGLWLKPSRRILDSWYRKTRVAVEPELQTLALAKRDTAVRADLDRLVTRLDALWELGEPLVGSQPVPKERRTEVVLAHWATRADNFAGRQATVTIETWIRNNLEPSEAQRRDAEAKRPDGRALPTSSR